MLIIQYAPYLLDRRVLFCNFFGQSRVPRRISNATLK